MKRKDYFAYFQVIKRRRGEPIWTLMDDAPKELCDFIRELHAGSYFDCGLPNDWIYEIVAEAFEALSEQDIDDVHIDTDIYYYDMKKWFNDNHFAHRFCDEAQADGMVEEEADMMDRIVSGQYMAKDVIYRSVYDFIQADEDEEDPDDEREDSERDYEGE